MSLLGMPWAMINLGCEMVYILHQRLTAQGIPSDKSVKVLQDIVNTMLEPGFLADKLFVAQDMYSLASTRKVFDKIAHSSIMKLSESSMDKLFDLMVMGAKHCLLCSTQLEEMLQITLRHLHTVESILESAAAGCDPPCTVGSRTVQNLKNAVDATSRFYGSLCTGDLLLLRCTLARYFQDKRVRVSLFLTEGIQLQSGKLVLASCVNDNVGLVRNFAADGKLEFEEKVQMATQQVDAAEFYCHPVPLGDNLYRKDRCKVVPPLRGANMQQDNGKCKQEGLPQQGEVYTQEQGGAGIQHHANRYKQQVRPATDPKASKELEFLAHLVNVAKPAAGDNFKLNLFLDSEVADEPMHSSHVDKQQRQCRHLNLDFDGKNDEYIKAARLAEVLQQVELEDKTVKDVGEELLDLMDSVV